MCLMFTRSNLNYKKTKTMLNSDQVNCVCVCVLALQIGCLAFIKAVRMMIEDLGKRDARVILHSLFSCAFRQMNAR